MTTFHLMISPPNRKPAVSKADKNDEVIPRLILAPFSPQAELKFGEVVISSVQSKCLLIFNPSTSMTIQFTNIDPDDRITLSDQKIQLNSREEKQILISWSPIHSGYLRKVIRAQDSVRKAKSFDVILSGMAVNKSMQNAKKKNPMSQSRSQKHSDSTMTLNQTSNQKLHDLRRQTYSIDEKENRQPVSADNSKLIMKSSSPKSDYGHLNVLSENSVMTKFSRNSSYDNVDAPTKYSNFEFEFNASNFINSNISDEMNLRRSTLFSMDTQSNVFSPSKYTFNESLEGERSNMSTGYLTDEFKNDDDVHMTPMKNMSESFLMSPHEVPPNNTKSVNGMNSTCESFVSNFSFKPSSECGFMFISPPAKAVRPPRKSNDFVHRTGSSAIKDRRKHLRTSFISKKRLSPKKLGNRRLSVFNESTVEKIKSQNPQVLKQVVTSQCHIEDPFVKQLVYNSDQWIDEQEKDIIKWMNSILIPSGDLSEENADYTIDGAEAWIKRNYSSGSVWAANKVPITLYNAPDKLDILRKRKQALMESEYVKVVFEDLSALISRKIIFVREGRDIYADEGIKNKLLQLLACYNPVWLRVGLEAVYGTEIALQPKADFGGLGLFIRKKVIVTSSFVKKTEKEKETVRRSILLKFLQLIFFMDQARIQKLIRHNGCLFTLKAKHKSSQSLLTEFCADLVTGRSYVMKHLKNIGYALKFKQTCIDEYDYTVTNLKDLNDGVRLTRLFEILFSERDLCSKLRVPAVDIENKKFNIDVAMKAAKARCTISGNITAEDFVLATRIGSRLKILSFLWQIIYDYLTPLYEKAAIKIQRWWRKRALAAQQRKAKSAQVIQTAWRKYKMRKNFSRLLTIQHFQQREKRSAQIIQSCFRTHLQRKYFVSLKKAVILIQRRYKAKKIMEECRRNFLELRKSALVIQHRFKSNKKMAVERNKFLNIKNASVVIQRRYRAIRAQKIERDSFLQLKQSVIFIQRSYRNLQLAKAARNNYLTLKNASVMLQKRFRAQKLMKMKRYEYVRMRNAVIRIQNFYRNYKLTCEKRNEFLTLKKYVVIAQRRHRANMEMKKQRDYSLRLRMSVINLQQRYRARKLSKNVRHQYLVLRWAAVEIQRQFRANRDMKRQRQQYEKLRRAAVLIQRQFRANQSTKLQRHHYEKLKWAAVVVQRQFRAKLVMKIQQLEYTRIKKAVFIIQSKYKATILMRMHKLKYENIQKATLNIQRRYRALRSMREQRKSYLALKKSTLSIQRRFRAHRVMQQHRHRYEKLRWAAIKIQRQFRANQNMKLQSHRYEELRRAVIKIQRQFRANQDMTRQRHRYEKMRRAAIKIQRQFRANQDMKLQSHRYEKLRQAALKIQRHFRANQDMKRQRQQYEELRRAAVLIQRQFRANQSTKLQRHHYEKLKWAAVIIQRQFRAKLEMKIQKFEYTRIKKAAFVIQSKYRATIMMRMHKLKYENIQKATLNIQRRYRALRSMREQRKSYLALKRSALILQREWKMKRARKQFLCSKNAAIKIQRWWLEVFAQKQQVAEKPKSAEELAAIKIQALWRGYCERKKYLRREHKPALLQRKENKDEADLKSTLQERYLKAIMQIKTSDLYDVILIALWNLERVTTFSAKLCKGVAAEDIVPIIFELMARGNRSEPSLEIYRASISILINLILYQPTKAIVWNNMDKIEDILRIVHIMKMTHEKFFRKNDLDLFRYSTTFLWLLCQDKLIAECIAKMPAVSVHLKKMKETLQRKCPCQKIPKQKRVAKVLPKTQTNWYADPKTRTFDDNCYAIFNLYNSLYHC